LAGEDEMNFGSTVLAVSLACAACASGQGNVSTSAPKTAEQFKSRFTQLYQARDADGLFGLYCTNGVPTMFFLPAKRLFQEHLKRNRPIEKITVTDIPADVLKEIRKGMLRSPTGEYDFNIPPEKMMTVIFEGGSDLSAFKALIGKKDGALYFVMTAPKKKEQLPTKPSTTTK
jgi:hypothetical protein